MFLFIVASLCAFTHISGRIEVRTLNLIVEQWFIFIFQGKLCKD